MSGNGVSFSGTQLGAIAAAYDASGAPAPIVIGHPATDAPAYGWVDRLFVEGGKLKATIRDTVAAFAEQVRAGRYRKVSVSLFKPDAPNNPKPGHWYLKHVGFLGAAAPAVAGLDPVRFAEAGLAETLEFTVDATMEMSAIERELVELRRERSASRLEKLVDAGKLLPAHKDEVLDFVDSLDASEAMSFAAGDPVTRRDWFLSFLDRQPKVVLFGQVDLGPGPEDTRPSLVVPDGFTADTSRQNLYNRARSLQSEKGHQLRRGGGTGGAHVMSNRKDRRTAGRNTLDGLMGLAFKVETANSIFQEVAQLDLKELPSDIADIVLTRSYLLAETAILFRSIGYLHDERRLAVLAGNRDFESVRRDLQNIVARCREVEFPSENAFEEFFAEFGDTVMQ